MNPRAQEILKRIKRLIKLIVEIVDNFPKKTQLSKLENKLSMLLLPLVQIS
jgi:hypothetical protein